jgi:hypothetical protein
MKASALPPFPLAGCAVLAYPAALPATPLAALLDVTGHFE